MPRTSEWSDDELLELARRCAQEYGGALPSHRWFDQWLREQGYAIREHLFRYRFGSMEQLALRIGVQYADPELKRQAHIAMGRFLGWARHRREASGSARGAGQYITAPSASGMTGAGA